VSSADIVACLPQNGPQRGNPGATDRAALASGMSCTNFISCSPGVTIQLNSDTANGADLAAGMSSADFVACPPEADASPENICFYVTVEAAFQFLVVEVPHRERSRAADGAGLAVGTSCAALVACPPVCSTHGELLPCRVLPCLVACALQILLPACRNLPPGWLHLLLRGLP
jgi:hypothetical protein